MYTNRKDIHSGDILYIDLPITGGSVQSGNRPCLVISNDANNKHSTTLNVIPITSRRKTNLPCHVRVKNRCGGLAKDSVLLIEQTTTVDKNRVTGYVGKITDSSVFSEVATAMIMQFDLLGLS